MELKTLPPTEHAIESRTLYGCYRHQKSDAPLIVCNEWWYMISDQEEYNSTESISMDDPPSIARSGHVTNDKTSAAQSNHAWRTAINAQRLYRVTVPLQILNEALTRALRFTGRPLSPICHHASSEQKQISLFEHCHFYKGGFNLKSAS